MHEPPERGAVKRAEVVDDAPSGSPRYGWFAGVLDGRVGDAAALRAAVQKLKSQNAVPCDLEVDGGRFSFMFDEAPVRGDQLSVERQDDLVEALQRFVAASADPAGVESTLRGSLVYGESVIETLFTVVNGEITPVSRKRTLEPRDQELAPDDSGENAWGGLDAPFRGKSVRGGLALLALILFGGFLLAWQSGYVGLLNDAFFAKGTDDVTVDAGIFGATLKLDTERKLAAYICEITRGDTYPNTPADVEALVSGATTTGELAAMNAIADGKRIWVRVVDAEGKTLAAQPIDLSPLLTKEGAVLEAKVRARAGAVRVELSLDSGLGKKANKRLDDGDSGSAKKRSR